MSRTVYFTVDGERCEADLHLPEPTGAGRPPIIVMAHGLGAVRAMGLDAYAERFVSAGYGCLVFDYRHFGGSDGVPRHLVAPRRQQADWTAAIDFARGLEEVDGDRIVAWGTSFGGGNVIATAATRPDGLVAAIAQCPFTDGIASTLAMSPRSSMGATLAAVRDVVTSRLKRAGSPILDGLVTGTGTHSTIDTSTCAGSPGLAMAGAFLSMSGAMGTRGPVRAGAARIRQLDGAGGRCTRRSTRESKQQG
ncbi:alpha/beta fold hydrolase [Rhodococcus triatomae]|uniref:X-Pro dipeptidyl-peptidase (S15 family) n=1 Tax=Rhodococcus triatomae TaxID=300028 RepID=A0A1G8H014_9NOCA|nr:alpha/beta fold hydrolase [Rhodococcus triatomae]QNG20248.1 alpha/beta fold hydrolase [Rhodococcus triatomae]QNG23837.1 alpha/beta fold hydrolase [Rhodococcus triatomae]SDH99944.1 X-Pro dipeptidyl-peptidase (S15 family) [Rhodococcus triatomae]